MRLTQQILLLFWVFTLKMGFVRLNPVAHYSEDPTRIYFQNVSVHQLTSGYLRLLNPDVTFLKISNSKMERIDKYAFDYLTHLNLLEISNSKIQYQIDPQTFSRLPGLEILVLKNLGLRRVNLNLTHVQELILAENEIEAIDGESINGKNVNFLDLSGNRLRVLAASFANMSKLSMIDVSKNGISEVLNVFEENVNLLRILASENRITSTEAFKLPWLKTLDLFANEITELDSRSFSEMTALEELVLAFNNIRHVEDAFRDLKGLKFLNLAWNHIEKLHPSLFRNNFYLTKLSLQGNKLRSLESFQSVHHHLTHLDLSHNQLSFVDDTFFHSIPSLQVLDLSFNRLTVLADVLSPLKELKILNMAYNDITMTGHELTANHQLIRVNFSSNHLQGGLSYFKNNSLLNALDLSDNEISHFCDADVVLKNFLKVSLKGNKIKSLACLKNFKSLCEIDLRNNPLTCGKELDGLILGWAKRKGAPYNLAPQFQADLLFNQCEKLSLNRSFSLWNSIKRELCPQGQDLEISIDASTREPESSKEEVLPRGTEEPAVESFEVKENPVASDVENRQKKPFIVLPIGWIQNDEMNKPNPMQSPQSERVSWERIDENTDLLKGFEDEEMEKKPRFSWYTIALLMIGLSLTLTCFNLAVFLYIRLKVWRKNDMNSTQKYTILQNEVYKNTTEPTKALQTGEGEWVVETQAKNKIFTYGKINECLLNFGLNKKDKDFESAQNVLISSTNSLKNC